MTELKIKKLKNIILYILKEFSGGVDYIKLYKILYFADKEQLAKTGIPLMADRFRAWQYGPVPALTGTLVKRLEDKAPLKGDLEVFVGALRVKVGVNNKVVAVDSPDKADLHPYSMNVLDRVIKKYKYWTADQLSKLSHDSAWDEAYNENCGKYNGREFIQPYTMAKDAGATDRILNFLERIFSKEQDYYTVNGDDYEFNRFERAVLTIRELTELTEGWDGEDAFPIQEATGMNCQALLMNKKARIDWLTDIYPTPIGSVCMDWIYNGKKVSAEVSHDKIAFYYVSESSNEVYDSPIFDYSEEAVKEVYHYIEKLQQND